MVRKNYSIDLQIYQQISLTAISYSELGRNMGAIMGLKMSANIIPIVRNGQNGI